ncbi:MAG TPA: DUF4136 domain-containing protein [Candidatus Acidoferrum sp.]|nr:DUF4136 domain-containing protein [Candidatus Acidoferrum sp.]
MLDFSKKTKRKTSPIAVMLAIVFLLAGMLATRAAAKTLVDFDPNLNFSKFKTFAYLGGVEHLALLPLNPNQIRDELHAAVARELGARGLKEVKPDQNPDLVVRYWVNTQMGADYAPTGIWNGFALYIGDYWAYNFDLMNAQITDSGSLLIDLIDVKAKDLAWRMYLEQKVLNQNDVWKKVNEEINKAFESYPPSEKQKEEKRKERAEHPPKPQAQ